MNRHPKPLPIQGDNACREGDQHSMTPAYSFSDRISETTETLNVGLNVRPPFKPLPIRSSEKSSVLSVTPYKWAMLRICFLTFCITCAATGGLLAFLTAPLVSRMYFKDYRFWKYWKFFIPMCLNFWRIVYRNITDKQYRAMFSVPFMAPPMIGPARTAVQVTKEWTTGTENCNTCQRCCTMIKCPLLNKKTGLCQSYDSFFWRYFNCGRYPLNQKQITYYGCPKWEVLAPHEG
jgi:hypothetical protein